MCVPNLIACKWLMAWLCVCAIHVLSNDRPISSSSSFAAKTRHTWQSLPSDRSTSTFGRMSSLRKSSSHTIKDLLLHGHRHSWGSSSDIASLSSSLPSVIDVSSSLNRSSRKVRNPHTETTFVSTRVGPSFMMIMFMFVGDIVESRSTSATSWSRSTTDAAATIAWSVRAKSSSFVEEETKLIRHYRATKERRRNEDVHLRMCVWCRPDDLDDEQTHTY